MGAAGMGCAFACARQEILLYGIDMDPMRQLTDKTELGAHT